MFPFPPPPLPAKVSFQWVFGAQRLMTTCFPTDMFNQQLIRGGQTHSAPLIWFFTLLFGVPHLSLCSPEERRRDQSLFMLYECCWMFVRSELHCHFSEERPTFAASLNASISLFTTPSFFFLCLLFVKGTWVAQGHVSQVHLTIDSRLCLCRRS